MRIAICDDEEACVCKLLTLVEAYCTNKRLLFDCQTFTDALAFQKSGLECYDVVFLDVNMGEIDGITTAKALRQVNQAAVLVYVSAFVEYAPLGYRVDAFRYLMKNDLEHTFMDCMEEVVERLTMNSKRLSLLTTEGEHQIVIASLMFFESFRHRILLHLADGRVLESRQHTLLELSGLLRSHSFLRIHKSFLVNPEYIVSMKSRVVTLTNGQTLSCGKTDYAEVMRTFMLWKGRS